MKNRLRILLVDNTEYKWVVKNNVDGDGSNRLTVYKDGKEVIKKLITGDIAITPKIVEQEIRSCE